MPGVILDIAVRSQLGNIDHSPQLSTSTSSLVIEPTVELVRNMLPIAFVSSRSPVISLSTRPPTVSPVAVEPVNRAFIENPIIPKPPLAPHSIIEAQGFNYDDINMTITRNPQQYNVIKTTVMELMKKAESGDKVAQVKVGDMYRNGNGIPQNTQAAINWYLRAVQQGGNKAELDLRAICLTQSGVTKDYLTAISRYRQAADHGSIVAQHQLGYLYYFAKDYPQAMIWFLKAAEQGDASAQNQVGNLYYNGSGTERDYQKAMSWYLRSADQGYSSAMGNVGVFYYSGHGVPRLLTAAVTWLRKGADQGDENGQYCLGILYEGVGVTTNKIQAMTLYKNAAKQGHLLANLALKRLNKQAFKTIIL
ncbi:hypothetical protein FBU30_010633 [Linnemannia zychae]|nr:hypothetical protein FBU30_010633 [Linnemannia zychae]